MFQYTSDYHSNDVEVDKNACEKALPGQADLLWRRAVHTMRITTTILASTSAHDNHNVMFIISSGDAVLQSNATLHFLCSSDKGQVTTTILKNPGEKKSQFT